MLDLEARYIPRGIMLSTVILYTLLTLMVLNLIFGSLTTTTYYYIARTALKILSLNIAFEGGVHYRTGRALYEILTLPSPRNSAKRQVL